jgi:hypothetical protein
MVQLGLPFSLLSCVPTLIPYLCLSEHSAAQRNLCLGGEDWQRVVSWHPVVLLLQQQQHETAWCKLLGQAGSDCLYNRIPPCLQLLSANVAQGCILSGTLHDGCLRTTQTAGEPGVTSITADRQDAAA